MPLQTNKKRQKRRKIKVTDLSRSVSKSSIVSLHEMKMQEHEQIYSNTKAIMSFLILRWKKVRFFTQRVCATCFTRANTASGNQACEVLDHMCVHLCCTDINAHCVRAAEEDWETVVFKPRVYLGTTWDNRERTPDSFTNKTPILQVKVGLSDALAINSSRRGARPPHRTLMTGRHGFVNKTWRQLRCHPR